MPSSTGWCTTPTGSNSTDNPSERKTLNYVTKRQKTDIKNQGLTATRQSWADTPVQMGGCCRNRWADIPEYADHYLSLHHHLFQDVYAWAGEIRDIRIHKDRTTFAYPENILMSLKAVFNDLATNKYLVDMEPREFAENAAHLLAEINAAHPFREGNGRTQLAFLSMVVENAGFPFNEDVIEPQTVVPAMIESFHSSNDALVKLIEKITAT